MERRGMGMGGREAHLLEGVLVPYHRADSVSTINWNFW